MVPPDYSVYFTTMAAVGATLFGLIFLVISITPESVATAGAPLERQAKAVMAYFALLNPLIISLFALVPHQQIGTTAISVGLFGFVNTLGIALTLYRNFAHWNDRMRHSLFILAGFVLYGYETYFSLRLLINPADSTALNVLADLLIAISIFGIARAWELIGVRQFHVRDWLSPRETPKGEEK